MITTASPGVLMHLGKPYAVGLLWFTVQDENHKSLLQQRIKKTKADYYCDRIHMAHQQGFGWLAKGHRRGMPVAASIVADQLVGEWHGMFEADNGWWYIQVRSDTITPQGDRFFTSEEEAYRVFQQEVKKHTWPHAYVPSKWNIHDSNVKLLELKNLLDGLETTTLVATNMTAIFGGKAQRNWILTGLASAFIVMGGLAIFSITKPPEDIVLPPPKMPVVVAKPIPALEPPKEDAIETLSAPQFVGNCNNALTQLFQTLVGWEKMKFICKGETAQMVWQKKFGTFTQAKEQGQKIWPSNIAMTLSGSQLTVNMKLDSLPKIQHESLLKQDEVLVFLEQKVQPLGAVQVKPVVPPAPRPIRPLPGKPPVKTPPPPLPRFEITLRSDHAPESFSEIVNLSGLEINQIEWQIPQAIWNYSMIILHARPEIVPQDNTKKAIQGTVKGTVK